MIYLVYMVVLAVYWKCPKYLKAIMFIINIFVPDAIPYVDELIMLAGLLKQEQ